MQKRIFYFSPIFFILVTFVLTNQFPVLFARVCLPQSQPRNTLPLDKDEILQQKFFATGRNYSEIFLRPGDYGQTEDSLRAAAQTAFKEGMALQKQNKAQAFRQAIEKYKVALQLWQTVGDSVELGNTYGKLGEVYYILGDFRSALDNFNQALNLKISGGDRQGESTARFNIASVLVKIGKNKEALAQFERTLEIRRSLGDRQGEARALGGIALVYGSLGKYEKALNYYQQQLEITRAINDSSGQASSLNSIGVLHLRRGENNKALPFFKKALVLMKATGNRAGEANVLNNLASIYDDMGKKEKALNLFKKALNLIRTVGNIYGEAYILNNIGVLYYQLGQYEFAMEYYERSLKLRQKMNDRYGEANALNNMGKVYTELGQLTKAKISYEKSLKICREIEIPEGETALHGNLGGIFRKLGEMKKAREHFEQALELSRTSGNQVEEANALNNLAGVYDDLGNTPKALALTHQALQLIHPLGNPRIEANVLYHLAFLEEKSGNRLKAKQYIETSLDLIESIRNSIATHTSRTLYFATIQKYYKFYISLLMKLNTEQPNQGFDRTAFQASERARARSLLDVLSGAQVELQQGIKPKLWELKQEIERQVNVKEQKRMKLLRTNAPAQQVTKVEKEIRSLLAQYQQLIEQIRVDNPQYVALIQPKILTVQEIQQQVLKDSTVLIEYSLGKEQSYLWVITKYNISSYMLPAGEQIENAAKALYEQLVTRNQKRLIEKNKEYGSQTKTILSHAALELSQMILKPAFAELKSKRILVVSEGALQYIPFGVLPVPGKNSESSKKALLPLIAEHEIVYLPSASVLPLIRKKKIVKEDRRGTVAILADPVFSADDPRVKRSQLLAANERQSLEKTEQEMPVAEQIFTRSLQESGLSTTRSGISRLPFSRQEAKAISTLVAPERCFVALDFQASYETATNPDLGKYQIIHFATHGLLNSQHPQLSGIVLSLVDEYGNPRNGFMRLFNIYNLNISADLVVLSACQTALGKEVKGEGLVGLTRGFMYAGASRVIASLWKVDDEATAELMKRFYQYLLGEEQLSIAAALRKAQISIMNEKRWQSPYYWASFILQGDWK